MIYYDPSEFRDNSTAPIIAVGRSSDNLERLTGADYLVTPVDMPATTSKLIQLHLTAGAIMVQAKRLADLPASVGERLHSSLITMQSFSAHPCQRLLVPCGLYFKRQDGSLAVGEQLFSQRDHEPYGYCKPLSTFAPGLYTNYKAIQTAIIRWTIYGGSVISVPAVSEFPSFLQALEAEVIKAHNADGQPRMVFSVQPKIEQLAGEGAIQAIIQAPPAVQILAALPGMGATLAQRAATYYLDEQQLDLLSAINQLASPAGNWFAGWGKGKAKNLAEALCLNLKPPTMVDNIDSADDLAQQSTGLIPE